jgi:hypothetical protein
MKSAKYFIPELFFMLLGGALLIRLFSYSVPAATDFEVYWHAIHAWIEGKSPYGHYSSEYVGLVFKYPPWILPLFLPFAYFDLVTSKWIWTIAQTLAIFYALYWVVNRGVRLRAAVLVSFLFWYIWFAHTYFGQITIFLLVCGLWALEPISHLKEDVKIFESKRLAFFVFLLTSKVFSLVSLIGCWKEVIRVRTLLFGILGIILSHIILLITSPKFSLFEAPHVIFKLYIEWINAASAGGSELGATIVRGQQNHGFAAAILRVFAIDSSKVNYDISLSLALAALFCGIWSFFSRKLPRDQQWAGWLSIGVITHPLAWHHSFVMAYPLCVFALDEALNVKQKKLVGFAVFSAICIGIFVPQVIGVEAVRPLELFANKSWGVVFSGVVLILANKQKMKDNLKCHSTKS